MADAISRVVGVIGRARGEIRSLTNAMSIAECC